MTHSQFRYQRGKCAAKLRRGEFLMSHGAIRFGDRHTGGGTMLEASGFPVNGIRQCLLGDKAECPTHNGMFPLVSGGDHDVLCNGRPLIFEPAQLACGCRVLSSCDGQYGKA
ncbi:PAAR domain-containing protein [Burkholderia cepacia]|uniref:PAAR domain-containing protein n=1 Tax=Burkholderia cepacia TaxID=292 RepID=UPI00384C5AFD